LANLGGSLTKPGTEDDARITDPSGASGRNPLNYGRFSPMRTNQIQTGKRRT